MSTLSVSPLRTDPRTDAQNLHRAFSSVPPDPDSPSFYHNMKMFGCDKAAVVQILAHRDARQRALIQEEYRLMFPRENFLLKRLSSKLSGNLKTSVLLWMTDPVERDLQFVKQGLSPETKNLQAATEVICSRTPSQIQSFIQQYSRFGVLENDIYEQASGHHRELLLAYVRQPRDEDLGYDTERAKEDSRALLGANEWTFIRIFSERSRAQLADIISAYPYLSGKSLEKAVKGKKWGLFGDALRAILSCSESPATYFAKVLHKALKCFRLDHTTLIRVIVTRTEIDMKDIKVEYRTRYGKTLNDAVDLQTTGHYRTFLLYLLGPNC